MEFSTEFSVVTEARSRNYGTFMRYANSVVFGGFKVIFQSDEGLTEIKLGAMIGRDGGVIIKNQDTAENQKNMTDR